MREAGGPSPPFSRRNSPPRDFTIPCFLLFLLALFFVLVLSAILVTEAFPAFAESVGILGPILNSGVGAVYTILFEGALLVFVLKRSDRRSLSRDFSWLRGGWRTFAEVGATTAVLISLGMSWSIVFPAFLESLVPGAGTAARRSLEPSEAWDGGGLAVALVALSSVVVAPLAEELLFRRTLPGVFRRRLPPAAALLLSALFFGLSHGWAWAPAAAAFGVVLSLAYLHHGSLLFVVLVHAVNNLVALLSRVFAISLDIGLPAGLLLFLAAAMGIGRIVKVEWPFVSRLVALPRSLPKPTDVSRPQPGSTE